MAALFVLALALIVWQAVRTKPASQPPFEVATEAGERLAPIAVPSWRTPLELVDVPAERLAGLEERALAWPGEGAGAGPCRLFVRVSSQHWAGRSASVERLRSWGSAPEGPWRRLVLPAASFLDDDDQDGDFLDAGELQAAGPGAEVEVFCGVTAALPEGES